MYRKIRVIVLIVIIYFIAILAKNLYEYRVKTFDEAIGFNLDNVYKVEILRNEQPKITEDKEKIKELTEWLRGYKYKMSSTVKRKIDFSYYVINFYSHVENGFIAFDKDNKKIIIVNGYTYDVFDNSIVQDYLQSFWESIR
ncbi:MULTISPECIES: hypothetical protein [Thermoanaerobacter]|jgi:hypothetical protein|uniref:Uncharacterized protein n=2 Tax=Thermoanaerobacter TaxID=1754 RepID=B0KCD8_THEP3|nr:MULTISPECIES: hypothetical protein [Thermoanaerobacter]ABY95492.1 hypothetical protein Teth39_1857 [Thermoanaerobacter pseudethanolicus ATCC 33223]ADV80434.1 hypothetical protein Thebr_1905 [Thermoanaerobacter brockii subsp. finnii Ako-1]HBW60732.1 hypothetical protein [Thermoanaerobacter sp.]